MKYKRRGRRTGTLNQCMRRGSRRGMEKYERNNYIEERDEERYGWHSPMYEGEN